MEITICITYDEEFKEAQIRMNTGAYSNTDYGVCANCREVRDTIVYATQEVTGLLRKAGLHQ